MMVYREKIELPTNTFTNLMAVRIVFTNQLIIIFLLKIKVLVEHTERTCESEAECEEIDIKDPDGEIYGDPFAIHIPNTPEINLCFTKYKNKCKIYLAIKLDDLDPEATASLEIETVSVGCRALDIASKTWSRDNCKVLKSTRTTYTGRDLA